MRPPRKSLRSSCVAASLLLAGAAAAAGPPSWAYPVNPPEFVPRADDGVARSVRGSRARYSVTQLRDRFLAPVWHPGDHPPLPSVVAEGRRPDVYACGYCHRSDGSGGPENADIAGLPAPYIVRQLADFASGARRSAVPARAPIRLKLHMAQHLSNEEVAAAAEYFSRLPPRARLRVVETDTVPRTRVASWILEAAAGGGEEPIGQRIIELPEDFEQFENRDSRARFIAYVPKGSIARGEWLVSTGGNGKTLPCAECHGSDLRGDAEVPPIVGRSPSYIVRQLYDIRHGVRTGERVQPMQAVVAALTIDDMLAIAACLAAGSGGW
ncbi:c-type cytochrome [Accumulibacter sp.]|uniref:c-type cytochrome n=1 Tax=Accumulibacter sp. TaxID=2053492 RepID=UPI0025FE70EB|nr:c-type cytochrome [Accumulibacter sp.]MCM8611752.1 cytochrome C-binding protein [Accumulibacter sp.]MCM8635657.1 cytochrome C-binding protein [Accumulibacter sp.]MCM8639244.1 cytochrome C-binding protein [Accumulibacter sp.]